MTNNTQNIGVIPEPPHISILIWEKAVGIVAAVFDVIKPAAEDRARVAVWLGAREAADKHVIRVVIFRAIRTHAARDSEPEDTNYNILQSSISRLRVTPVRVNSDTRTAKHARTPGREMLRALFTLSLALSLSLSLSLSLTQSLCRSLVSTLTFFVLS